MTSSASPEPLSAAQAPDATETFRRGLERLLTQHERDTARARRQRARGHVDQDDRP